MSKRLKPTIDHLKEDKVFELCRELVQCAQALGPLSSNDVTSELVSTLEKYGIEWDHEKLPEYGTFDRICLCQAHTQRGTVIKPGLKRTKVRWDDDGSIVWVSNDDVERV